MFFGIVHVILLETLVPIAARVEVPVTMLLVTVTGALTPIEVNNSIDTVCTGSF